MVQLKEAMARIRLVLVEISAREEQMDAMIGQFRTQLERLPKQAVYGNAGLELALSAMEEVQDRLSHAKGVRQHLQAIKQKASDELSALQLTQQVEEAKGTLRDLQARVVASESSEELAAEVRRLEEFIAEYSKQAEHAITSGLQENDV